MSYDLYEQLSIERKQGQENGTIPEWFTTSGWQMFKQKYLYQAENPREQFMRIAKTAAKHAPKVVSPTNVGYDIACRDISAEDYWAGKFFNVLWNGHVCCSTPILANMGTNRGCPVSCAGSVCEDSIEGFYDAYKEIAILTKQGFGTATDLSGIRKRGSPISVGGKASGVLPVIKHFVQDMRDVAQGTARRGAWAGYLNIEHGDFWEVVQYLEEQPDGLNLGWIITDKFIAKLRKGNKEATKRYQRALKAKMIFGKGYFFFIDKVNRQRPEMYKDLGLMVKSSQLCSEILLHSSLEYTYTCQPKSATVIKKDIGLSCIGDVKVGDNIWSSQGWTKVVGKVSSGMKDVFEYRTSGGVFLGTADHRILQRGAKIEVGHAVAIDGCPPCEVNGNNITEFDVDYVVNGLMLGDGTLRNQKPVLCVGKSDQDYYSSEISGVLKKEGYSFFRDVYSNLWVDVSVKTYERNFSLPEGSSDLQKRSFLRGLFSANGSSVKQKRDFYNIVLKQSSYELVRNVQVLLASLGISSNVYKQTGVNTTFKNGEYLCKDSFSLVVMANECVKRFKSTIGFIQKHKMDLIVEKPIAKNTKKTKTYNISEKVFVGNEEVFHIEVDNSSHTYWTGGLDVSNCVLSWMNLAKADEWKDTDAVFVGTVFLDCVVSEFLEQAKKIRGMEKAVAATEKGRAIGLGAGGFHTYLQAHNMEFGGLPAHLFNGAIFQHIDDESLKASKWLAEELGEPEWCRGYGLRFTHRMAVAPTKSTALIYGGISEGINPDVAMSFTQLTAAGEVDRVNPTLLALIKSKGLDIEACIADTVKSQGSVQHVDWLTEDEKRIFKTAFEINQRDILRLAATRQKYIDQGQSTNLFFAGNADEGLISEIHQQAFEDENILSLYYVYSSRGVVSSSNECVACQ